MDISKHINAKQISTEQRQAVFEFLQTLITKFMLFPILFILKAHTERKCTILITSLNGLNQSLPLFCRHRVVVSYPPQSEAELELKEGDIVFVHKKREDGWFKGTLQRNGKTGLFPGSFVENI